MATIATRPIFISDVARRDVANAAAPWTYEVFPVTTTTDFLFWRRGGVFAAFCWIGLALSLLSNDHFYCFLLCHDHYPFVSFVWLPFFGLLCRNKSFSRTTLIRRLSPLNLQDIFWGHLPANQLHELFRFAGSQPPFGESLRPACRTDF